MRALATFESTFSAGAGAGIPTKTEGGGDLAMEVKTGTKTLGLPVPRSWYLGLVRKLRHDSDVRSDDVRPGEAGRAVS